MVERMAAPAKALRPVIARAQTLVAWVQRQKTVRVFTLYAAERGPILASGLAFQLLFAVFSGLWVAFSIAGLVISHDQGLQNAIIGTLNNVIPGLIDTGPGTGTGSGSGTGAIKVKLLLSAGVFGWTGAIALLGLLVIALGWLASARDAVRTMFDLRSAAGNFLQLKARDFGLGLALGVVLIVSAVLSVAGTSATGWLLGLVGVHSKTALATVVSRIVTLAIMFALDTVVLAAIYRVLSAIRIPRSRLWAGALLGAVGLGVLKVLGSALLGGATNNPLIASFAVLAGLLIFFNFVCQVILLAASWIKVGLDDAGLDVDPRVAGARLEEARSLVAANEPDPAPRASGLARVLGPRRRGRRR